MATNIAELRSNSGLAAKDYGENNLAKFFASHETQMKSVIPEHLDTKRLLRIAVNAIRTTPQLQKCTVESLLGATINAAIMGLEPNTPLGHAYLVPFYNSKRRVMEVQLIPGYKGLIDLARRSGQIVSIAAHEICTHDHFEFEYGLEEKLVHRPAWNTDRGEVVGAYAVAHLKDGGHVFEVMSINEINAIRDKSAGYEASKKFKFSSPWDTHFGQMARKTVIRRLANYLPMSIEMADAITMDNTAETASSQGNERALEGDFTVLLPSNDNIDTETGEVLAPAQIGGATVVPSDPEKQTVGEFEESIPWAGDDSDEGRRQQVELKKCGFYTDGKRFFNAAGDQWNPEIHATSADKGPIINAKDGSFRKARSDKADPPPAEQEQTPEVTEADSGNDATTPGNDCGNDSGYGLD